MAVKAIAEAVDLLLVVDREQLEFEAAGRGGNELRRALVPGE